MQNRGRRRGSTGLVKEGARKHFSRREFEENLSPGPVASLADMTDRWWIDGYLLHFMIHD